MSDRVGAPTEHEQDTAGPPIQLKQAGVGTTNHGRRVPTDRLYEHFMSLRK